MSAFDLQNESDVKEYLEKLGIEYRFGCYSEKKADGTFEHTISVSSESLSRYMKRLNVEVFFFFFISSSLSLTGRLFRGHQEGLWEGGKSVPIELWRLWLRQVLLEVRQLYVPRQGKGKFSGIGIRSVQLLREGMLIEWTGQLFAFRINIGVAVDERGSESRREKGLFPWADKSKWKF